MESNPYHSTLGPLPSPQGSCPASPSNQTAGGAPLSINTCLQRGFAHCRLTHAVSSSVLHVPTAPSGPVSVSAVAFASRATSCKHLDPKSAKHELGGGGGPWRLRGISVGGGAAADGTDLPQPLYGMSCRQPSPTTGEHSRSSQPRFPLGLAGGAAGTAIATGAVDPSLVRGGKLILRAQSSYRRHSSMSAGIAPQLLAISDYLSATSAANFLADGSARPGSSGKAHRKSGAACGPNSGRSDGLLAAAHTPVNGAHSGGGSGGSGGGSGGSSGGGVPSMHGSRRTSSARRRSVAAAAAAAGLTDTPFASPLYCPVTPLASAPSRHLRRRCNSAAVGDPAHGAVRPARSSCLGPHAASGGSGAAPRIVSRSFGHATSHNSWRGSTGSRTASRAASNGDDTSAYRSDVATAAAALVSCAAVAAAAPEVDARAGRPGGSAHGSRGDAGGGPSAGGAKHSKEGKLADRMRGKWQSAKAALIGVFAPLVGCSGVGAGPRGIE